MKSLVESIYESFGYKLDDNTLKKYDVTQQDLTKVVQGCGMDLKTNKPVRSDAYMEMTVINVTDEKAEKFAKHFDMHELTDKEIREVRDKLFLQERTWIAKLGDNVALEFRWFGAKRKTQTTEATVVVFDINEYFMGDRKFVKYVE